MAFYSKSFNDIGEEIDGPKLNSDLTSPLNPNSEYTSASSTGGIYSRYLHSAICIAKTDSSTESLSDTSQSIVPSLDLNSSGETMPSTGSAPGASFSAQKTFAANRMPKSEAFQNWLSGKKKIKSYEKSKLKEMELERQKQQEERKQLAEQKYREWLAKKNQLKEKPPIKNSELQDLEEVRQTDDSESNRRAWEQKKAEEQRKKREQMYRAREKQKLLEEKRKQQASIAFQNWVAEAPLKPKPVPLNKGFLSLKGTISEIFVNENPWHGPYEEIQCE